MPSFGVTEGSHLGVIDPAGGEWLEIWGRTAPTMKALARRAAAFDREKPRRQSDDDLYKILLAYHEKPVKGCRGLRHLHGITRTSRYRAGIRRSRAMIGAR